LRSRSSVNLLLSVTAHTHYVGLWKIISRLDA
jgi:hypothetical protein